MNWNRLAGGCAGLVLSAAIAGSALAQGGRDRFFGGGPLMLLRMPEVQAELKITDEQKPKLMEAAQKAQGSLQGLREKLQNASPEERQKILADFQAEQAKAVNAVLSADQQKRLRQLQLQQEGPSAAARPDVAAELKITDEQKTKIQALMQAQREQIQALFQNGGGAQGAFEKVQALRKETNDKIAALLTDEQKGKWKGMLGAEFKFPEPRRPGQN